MKTIFIGFRFLILLCFSVYTAIVQNPDEIFLASNRDKLVNGSAYQNDQPIPARKSNDLRVNLS